LEIKLIVHPAWILSEVFLGLGLLASMLSSAQEREEVLSRGFDFGLTG